MIPVETTDNEAGAMNMISSNDETTKQRPAHDTTSPSRQNPSSTSKEDEPLDSDTTETVSKRAATKLATEIADCQAELKRLMSKHAALTATAAPAIVKALSKMSLPSGFRDKLVSSLKKLQLVPAQRTACDYVCHHVLKEDSAGPNSTGRTAIEEAV